MTEAPDSAERTSTAEPSHAVRSPAAPGSPAPDDPRDRPPDSPLTGPKPRDASTVPDADWSTVTEYFRLLHDVSELNRGNLQIIVCDHANLPDDWFQQAVIDNWRPNEDGTRNAPIPPRWLT
ncbi:DUF3732 domain-containing protein [Streptomyces sp. DT20]|uniref:DUF3732 domain-containing protein n=1 Tax=Streptomyces sp. DT20 TaxID=3416519 RepID=UPI003CE6DAF3